MGTVASGTANGTLIQGRVLADYDGGGASAARDVVVTSLSGLELRLMEDPNPVVAGGEIRYTATVSNRGSTAVTNALLTVPLPAGSSLMAAPDGGVLVDDRVQWNLGTLPAGSGSQRQLRLRVGDATPVGSVLVVGGEVRDGDNQNLARGTTATVVAASPLRLRLTANPDPVRSGEKISYQVTVSNAGAVALHNVQLQLVTPSRVSIYRTQISAGGDCPQTVSASCGPGEPIIWPVGTLEPGASRTVQAMGAVYSGTANGTLIQGRVLADHDGGGASAARDVVVTSLSGLGLGLVEDPNPVVAGGELRYTVTVSNRGSTAVTNVLLTVLLPAGSSLVAAPDGGVLADNRVQWNLGTLTAGSGSQRQLRLRVGDATPVGSVLVVGGEVRDGDNQNLARGTTATVVAASPLRLRLTANPDPVRSGEKISYQVTVSNAGAVALHNVQLQLVTPSRVSIYRTQISAGGDCPQTVSASCGPGEPIIWPVGTLEPGASRTVQAMGAVYSGTANGTLIQGRVLADHDGGGASAARDVVVTSLSGLGLGLVEDPNPVVAGGELRYTVTVSNRGSTAVTNVLLTVLLPAGSSLVAAPDGGVLADNRVQWNLGTLTAGSGSQRQLRLRVADATPVGSVLLVDGEVRDGDNQNLARGTTATVVAASPLRLTLTANPDPVRSGEQLFYRVTVSNVGTVVMNNVQLQLVTPNWVSIYRTQISAGGNCPWTVSASCGPGEPIIWPVGTLEPGASWTVQAVARVDGSTSNGTLIQAPLLADHDGGSASAAHNVIVNKNAALDPSGIAPTLGSTGTPNPSATIAEPINTATGNYFYQQNDLQFPGRGLPLAFIRTYNSLNTASGPLGYGWTHAYGVLLTQYLDGSIVVVLGNGRQEFYDPGSDGSYQSRLPGVFNTLRKNDDGTFTLTAKNQFQHHFNAAGKLTRINDRNGNALTFSYDANGNLTTLVDTAGRTSRLTYDASKRIKQISDPMGRTVTYTYDASGNLTSVTDPRGAKTSFTYDAQHRLTRIVDRRGNTLVANTYDAAGRVSTQTNGRGFVTTLAYDTPNPGDTQITDPRSGVTIHTHDAQFRLLKETDPLGNSVAYSYDANNNRIRITDKNGKVTQYTYDDRGNVLSRTDALGKVTTLDYNSLNNPTRLVDALGNVTTLAYDAKGNLTGVTNALGQSTTIAYDALGQPITLTNARGHAIQNSFDAQGNWVQVQAALGYKIAFSYDGIGRRTGMTDANNHTVSLTYDDNSNLLTVTDPLENKTTLTYDANDNLTRVTDPRGSVAVLAYDANDLLTTVTDPLGKSIQAVYDAADNLTALTDARGNTTQYAYDAANRLIKVTDALGKVTALAYDPNGNLLQQTNPLGHVTRFAYDAVNRLLSATDALNNTGLRVYDALGRVTQTQDANGRVTRYAYDTLGRLVQVSDSAGGKVAYAYDEVGNRTAITDPNGHSTTLAYDALNRLIRKTDPLGHAYSYTYDAVGNRSGLTDAKGQTFQYGYDGNNRLLEISYPDASSVAFTYDAAGNRTRMVDTLGTSTYGYDALNRLTSYTNPFGKTVGSEYDAAGNRTAVLYPNGKQVTYSYDALNRLATVTDWLGKVTGYTYDDASNLAAVLNPNQTTVSYTYDNAERLVKLANTKADSSLLAGYDLTLDAVGNRTGINRVEPLAPRFKKKSEVYAYDNDNRLLKINTDPVTHDADGNLTAKPGATYQYDFEDRLLTVSGNASAQYGYDGVGNRLRAVRNSVETRYTLDIAGPLSNVLVENDAAGNPLAYYVHGLGLISRITPSGDVRYYHYDTIGSTVALTDNGGNMTDAYTYAPFGQVLNTQGSVNNPFRYVGQFGVMEEGNGLQFMRARYYDSGVGRFVGKDPLVGNVWNSQSRNQYAYALNDPVRFFDASGLSAQETGNDVSAETIYKLVSPGTYKRKYVDCIFGGKLVCANEIELGVALNGSPYVTFIAHLFEFSLWATSTKGFNFGSVTEGYGGEIGGGVGIEIIPRSKAASIDVMSGSVGLNSEGMYFAADAPFVEGSINTPSWRPSSWEPSAGFHGIQNTSTLSYLISGSFSKTIKLSPDKWLMLYRKYFY